MTPDTMPMPQPHAGGEPQQGEPTVLQPPSALRAVLELSYTAALEARRSNLVTLSLWVAGLGSLLALSTTEATHIEHGRLVIDAGLLAASALGTITAAAMTLQTFAGESDGKSVVLSAVHPIPRWTLIVGRTLGHAIVLSAMVAIIAISVWALLQLMGEPVGRPFWYAFGALPCELLVVQSTTLLFATLAQRPFAAAMSVGLFVAGNLSEDILAWAQNPRMHARAWALYALHAVLPDYAHLSLRHYAANGMELPDGLFAQTILYGLAYAGVALVLASICFSRRRSL